MKTIDHVPLSDHCAVTLHRTLRVPDGGDHPLPPSLGAMDVFALGPDEFVVPMHRSEALWLSFEAPFWRPHALKVGVGGIDAVSGRRWAPATLHADEQDYVVIGEQPWLDGINAGDGFVRQFVAVPLGAGLTVESQLDDGREVGGLHLSLFAPRPGRFPDSPPPQPPYEAVVECMGPADLGIGAGGCIRQEIYADEHGVDTWEPAPSRSVRIDLVDALVFAALTGIPAPRPAVDAATYTAHGLPWFDLYSPTLRDVMAASRLAGVRSVADLEGAFEAPVAISEAQVVRLLGVRTLAGGAS